MTTALFNGCVAAIVAVTIVGMVLGMRRANKPATHRPAVVALVVHLVLLFAFLGVILFTQQVWLAPTVVGLCAVAPPAVYYVLLFRNGAFARGTAGEDDASEKRGSWPSAASDPQLGRASVKPSAFDRAQQAGTVGGQDAHRARPTSRTARRRVRSDGGDRPVATGAEGADAQELASLSKARRGGERERRVQIREQRQIRGEGARRFERRRADATTRAFPAFESIQEQQEARTALLGECGGYEARTPEGQQGAPARQQELSPSPYVLDAPELAPVPDTADAPLAPDMSDALSVPDAPIVSDASDRLGVSSVPDAPLAPGAPDTLPASDTPDAMPLANMPDPPSVSDAAVLPDVQGLSSQAPKPPGTPDTPGTPGTPGTPDTAQLLETLEVPELLDTPDMPELLEPPELPDAPVLPEATDKGGARGTADMLVPVDLPEEIFLGPEPVLASARDSVFAQTAKPVPDSLPKPVPEPAPDSLPKPVPEPAPEQLPKPVPGSEVAEKPAASPSSRDREPAAPLPSQGDSRDKGPAAASVADYYKGRALEKAQRRRRAERAAAVASNTLLDVADEPVASAPSETLLGTSEENAAHPAFDMPSAAGKAFATGKASAANVAQASGAQGLRTAADEGEGARSEQRPAALSEAGKTLAFLPVKESRPLPLPTVPEALQPATPAEPAAFEQTTPSRAVEPATFERATARGLSPVSEAAFPAERKAPAAPSDMWGNPQAIEIRDAFAGADESGSFYDDIEEDELFEGMGGFPDLDDVDFTDEELAELASRGIECPSAILRSGSATRAQSESDARPGFTIELLEPQEDGLSGFEGAGDAADGFEVDEERLATFEARRARAIEFRNRGKHLVAAGLFARAADAACGKRQEHEMLFEELGCYVRADKMGEARELAQRLLLGAMTTRAERVKLKAILNWK